MKDARRAFALASVLGFAASACTSHGGASASSDSGRPSTDSGKKPAADAASSPTCSGAVHTSGHAAGTSPAAPAVTLPTGFTIEVVATLTSARQLVALPSGDLLVGTKDANVYLVPNAEAAGAADEPVLFATVTDAPVQGLAFDPETCTLAIGASHGVYTVAYADGQTTAAVGASIAKLRTGPVTHTASDSDTHLTTSVAFAGGKLYVGVGSSCNACVEVDPGRAVVLEMNADGSGRTTRATRIRNPIAMTVNPVTGTLWLGGAGQDALPEGHPYELFDGLTLHAGEADYGWPACEENLHAYIAGSDCASTVAPRIELPAYSTLIGAAFYPTTHTGAYAFPSAYRGGLFVTAHGSWHQNANGTFFSPPRVAFVGMQGDDPAVAVDWTDPSKQWTEFVGGFQFADGKTRIGRPTGIAVGAKGSLFVADDQDNFVYRIRPQ